MRRSHLRDLSYTFSHLAAAISLAFLASACGNDPSSSEIRDLDYTGLEVIQGYTVFKDSEQAKEWYASYRPTLSLALNGDTGDVVDFGDARYATLNDMVANLWQSYQKLYADNVSGVPAPIVLLLQNNTANAFATYDRSKQMQPNAFFVNSGLIESNFANKDAIFGTIAHELAHHVLRHPVPGVSATVDKFYAVKGSEPLGALQRNDDAVKSAVTDWISAAQAVGPFSLPELRGAPMPSIGFPLLYTAETQLAAAHKDRDACAKMTSDVNNATDVMAGGLNVATQELIIADAAERQKLDAARIAYNKDMTDCIAGENRSILQIMVDLFHVPEGKASDGMTAAEIALVKKEGNTAASLVAYAEAMSDKKVEINSKLELSTVRRYTIEEQADDVAIEVLLDIGASAAPLIEEFKSTVPAAQLDPCLATIGAGKVPGYGILSDNHHSACYRIFHARKIEEYLKTKATPGATPGDASNVTPVASN